MPNDVRFVLSIRLLVTFLLSTNVILTLSPSGCGPLVEAGVPPCYCGQGTVASSTPTCKCTCPGRLVGPNCRYLDTDMIHVEAWVGLPPTVTSSDSIRKGIESGLSLPSGSVGFLTAAASSTYPNVTMFSLRVSGKTALLLKIAVAEQQTWVAVLGIIAVFDALPEPPKDAPYLLQLATSVYLFNDGRFAVSVDDVGWLIGALVLLFLANSLERCCFDNDEEKLRSQDGAAVEKYGHKL